MRIWLPILVVVFLAGCSETPAPPPPPKFHLGDMVEMIAFGHVGMVVRNYCYRGRDGRPGYCNYSVRFGALQLTTNVRLLGRDGPIELAPVALVHGIGEFELRAVDD